MGHKKITDTNNFKAIKTLEKIADDPRIEEIEGSGMDEGRVFIHLKPGFRHSGEGRTRSVGSAKELRIAMSLITPDTREQS